MLSTFAFILLTLYSAIIVVSYAAVRQGWIRAYPVFLVSGVANALVVFVFSLLRGNMLLQAAIVGPLTGFIFAGLSVVSASLYRSMAPGKVVKHELAVLAGPDGLSLEQVPGSVG